MINKVASTGIGLQSVSLSEKKTSTGQRTVAGAPGDNADSVTLSGHALMLSRLFGQDDSTYTGQVMTDRNDASGALVPYLTGEDRAMLEKMYDYSVANGIDLKHVDALGEDLAIYRRFGTSGGYRDLYDTAGHAMTFEFSKADKAAAERIANNSPASTIDHGFLQSELVVGTHMANFTFLERMTEVFSTAPPEISPANQEAIAAYSAEANKPVVTVSKDVQLVIPEADYISVDGVGHWRTPELEAAHNARFGLGSKGSAINGLISSGDDNIRSFLTMLDGYARNHGVSSARINSMLDLLDSAPVKKLWSEISGAYDKTD